MSELGHYQLDVSPAAQKLLRDRPLNWGHRLFFQVLIDEISASCSFKDGPPMGVRAVIGPDDWATILKMRLEAFTAIAHDLVKIDDIGEACNSPEMAENLKAIVRAAQRVATRYRQLIEWRQSLRFADAPAMLGEVFIALSSYADAPLEAVERYGPDGISLLEDMLARPSSERTNLNHHLVLGIPPKFTEDFNAAIVRLKSAPNIASGAGYLYILQNPSMGSLLKIGKTSRSAKNRVAELSAATGVPTPFVLAFEAFVADCSRAEAFVHNQLEQAGYRVSDNREFFNVDLKSAIELIITAQRMIAPEIRAEPRMPPQPTAPSSPPPPPGTLAQRFWSWLKDTLI